MARFNLNGLFNNDRFEDFFARFGGGSSDAIACPNVAARDSHGVKRIASFLCGPALFARVFVTR